MTNSFLYNLKMDYSLNTTEYKLFLNNLPQYDYKQKIKILRSFLQRLSVNIINHLQPNEQVEWFFFESVDDTISTDEDYGEAWYLINTTLPLNINKNDVDFIPKKRFDFIKTSSKKATVKLSYAYVHLNAGDR